MRVVAVLMWSTPFPPVYDSEMLPATIVVQLTKPTSSAPVGLNLVNGDEASSPPVLVEVRGLAAWSKCHLAPPVRLTARYIQGERPPGAQPLPPTLIPPPLTHAGLALTCGLLQPGDLLLSVNEVPCWVRSNPNPKPMVEP